MPLTAIETIGILLGCNLTTLLEYLVWWSDVLEGV